ncbi:hypothetical protein ACQ4M3_13220 [Leptolyngbya sp. AN03gr2]|uniref:hypothetical protein n=1 Tax=unclassified Leptolyngbya TaxID=2650499 RepID=UPI003D31006C
MPKDLQLLIIPAYYTQHTQDWLANTNIALHRERNLEDLIDQSKLPIEPLPRTTKISWQNKHLQKDPYGDRLTYCLAGDFRTAQLPEDLNEWNQAMFQCLRSLPEESVIIFYWT